MLRKQLNEIVVHEFKELKRKNAAGKTDKDVRGWVVKILGSCFLTRLP
jgi:hypothetical protein